MAVEDRTRHDRLRSLLPRSFATEPETSALGTVVEVLADLLRESDGVVERALRDKWLRTASGPRALDAQVSVTPPAGWLSGADLPKPIRDALQADATLLGVEIGELLGHPAVGVRALLGQFDPPLDKDKLGPLASTVDELLTRLAPLGLPLGGLVPDVSKIKPQVAERTTFAGARQIWVRWAFGGEALEVAVLLGSDPAIVLVRGPADARSYRSAVDRLYASLDFPLPLELLGAALDLRRQPWEHDHEAYRSRVRILAPLLTEGLATPRVILAFGLTSLGAEPCPILDKTDPQSTRGFGVPPRALDRCRVCRGGKRPAPGSVCPQRERAIMDATVTDTPRLRARLTRSSLDPATTLDASDAGQAGKIRIRNDSLFAARPEIVLRLPLEAGPGEKLVPSFRSLTTGEEVVLPVIMTAGDELRVRPSSPHDPATPNHLQVWVDLPLGEAALPGRTWVRNDETPDQETEAPNPLFASGPRFDQARFASVSDQAAFDEGHWDEAFWDEPLADGVTNAYHFAGASREAATPKLVPGDNVWIFRPLGGAQLAALLGDYEGLTFAELPGFDQLEDPNFPPSTATVSIELRWWTRSPARFRLRVPRTPAVEQALAAGAADYLRRMIDRVRPAGVHPILDFSIGPFRDFVDPSDRFSALALRSVDPVEPQDQLALGTVNVEPLDPSDEFGFIGIFDVTHFTISRFGPKYVLPGQLDQTEFEWSTFNDFGPPEAGEFNTTFYDHALLTDLLPGDSEG